MFYTTFFLAWKDGVLGFLGEVLGLVFGWAGDIARFLYLHCI
jgi:hypothetical protein